MCKLIDAEKENAKLLDFIAQNGTAIVYAIEHKDMTMLEGIFAEYFESQETAYDVEKVVQEMKKNKDWKFEPIADRIRLDDAIHIVRKGGVI